ncbi:uncharacterized protein LOC135383744 [Ornithodoros turicata]|uniref:uncharacterized protein LOC135383744 n=1 Tax=Ornithodoros turicata TaxID=34597 RepID=UPI003139D179
MRRPSTHSIHASKGSIHASKGSVHLSKASVHASKASVHASKGSLYASKASLQASRASVHPSRGSLTSPSPMADLHVMNSSNIGDMSSLSGSLATRTGAGLAVLSPILTSESALPHTTTATRSITRTPSVSSKGPRLLKRKPQTPVEAVYANGILFPDYDPSWMEDSNSAPHAFDVLSNTEIPSDHEIHRVYSCMMYVVCIGIALLIVVLGVVGIYVTYTGAKSHATTATSEAPRLAIIICYSDPVRGRAASFKIAQSCIQCCTHLVYDGMYSDANGDVTLRAVQDQITSDELNSWRALKKRTSQPHVYVGLRSENPLAETVKKPEALNRLMQSLRTSFAEWDGVAIFWDDITSTDPNLHKFFFQTLHDTFQGTSFGVLAHIIPAGLEKNNVVYDLDALVKFSTAIVVHTHEFVIPGKAYPPCSFDMSESLPESQDVNWVHVINELLQLDAKIALKLLPTVSTLGKKYTLADASKTDIGELVTGSTSFIALSEICPHWADWDPKFDPSTKCEYGFNNQGEWIGFEGNHSIVFKTELIKKRNFYGIAVMDIEMDDSGYCNSSVKNYLLNTVHNELHGTAKHLH